MKGSGNLSDEFHRDAVAQIAKRGYSVSELSKRFGVSTHSLYACKKSSRGLRESGDAGQEEPAEQATVEKCASDGAYQRCLEAKRTWSSPIVSTSPSRSRVSRSSPPSPSSSKCPSSERSKAARRPHSPVSLPSHGSPHIGPAAPLSGAAGPMSVRRSRCPSSSPSASTPTSWPNRAPHSCQ